MLMDKDETKNSAMKIDYSQLMDLRIDYAFKAFVEENPEALISILNAIFANANINRVVKSVRLKNPTFDKKSVEDKLSILDVRAELEDGTDILVEMHLHGIGQILAKMIRSWARAYSEELETSKKFTSQPPTIAIAFVNGAIEPIEKPDSDTDEIHGVYMIMNRKNGAVLTNAMELHFIDMKAFAKAVNEANSINIKEPIDDMFAYWLSVITEKEINNKDIIENARKEKEVIGMAVSAIAKQSEDKVMRQAYQRRRDEIFFHNVEVEGERQRANQLQALIDEKDTALAEKDARIAQLEALLKK